MGLDGKREENDKIRSDQLVVSFVLAGINVFMEMAVLQDWNNNTIKKYFVH